MSTHTFGRLRSTTYVMVLLSVAAALLPAQRAAADLTFPLTREETNRVFYDWYQQHVYQGGKQIKAESWIVARLINNTTLPTTEMTDQLAALTARYYTLLGPRGADVEYRRSLPLSTLARAMYDAGVQTPAFKDAVVKAHRDLKQAADDERATEWSLIPPDYQAAYEAVTRDDALSDAYRTLLDQQIDQALERGKADAQFAKVWDKYFAPDARLSIATFDAKTFLAAYPEAPIPQPVRDAVRPDGSMEVSLADLERLARDELGKINSSIDEIQQTLGEITKQQGELVDYMRNQQKRQQDLAKAEAANKKHQLRLQAAGSAISIVANLVSIKDPKKGRQIAVVGSAALTIADSLRTWTQAVSGLNTLNKLTSLSTVVMTGNVLGAVMSIVSVFGPQEPPPEQFILEEIGKLRQQVNELRTEMHERFDRVDAQLNTIYTSMQQRFNQIDIQLGKINGRLDEIQQSLLELDIALNRMERNNVEYLSALGRRPLREAINGSLGYRQRTGLDMPYQPDFVNYENTFHTWGTVNAFDALSAGPTQRDYSDGQVLAELSSAPLDANVNYLNGWLVAHGMQPFAGERLAGPRDWTFASRAYAELGFDSPAHLKRIDPRRQAALDAVGDKLQQAMQNISTIQTPGGPQGNGSLFTGLTDYYGAKLEALDGALRASEAAYAGDVQLALNRPSPLDVYGGLDQALPYPFQPADFETVTCGGRYDLPLPTPFNLKNMVPAYNRFALADYLRLLPLNVCFGVDYVEVSPECYPTPANCEPYGKLRVRLGVFSENVGLMRSEVVGFRQKVVPEVEALARDWRFYKVRFEAKFAGATQPDPLTPEGTEQLNKVSSALTGKLAELQRVHAGRVLNELNSGTLRTRAVELAGAKKLLESFATLGFPRAIDADDFLRSLLFSKEALIDDQQIALTYGARLTPAQPATTATGEAQLPANPRVELLNTGTKRRDALKGLVSDYLGAISTETYREDSTMIAGTRFDLEVARAAAGSNVASPGSLTNSIYLPLARR